MTATTGRGRAVMKAWRPTWAWRRVVVTVPIAVSLALVFGRPTLALLVLPLAVGAAMAWAQRDDVRPSAGLVVDLPPMCEQGGPGEAAIEITGLTGVELATVALPHGLRRGASPVLVVAASATSERLEVAMDTSGWGVRSFGPAGLRVASADGLYASDVLAVPVPPTRVLPRVRTVPVPELPARTTGQVGAHRTRRPGDGSELLDVREFRPGDRIRRIDWRVSARRDALHVRHTAIDADADLVLFLDPRFDLGTDVSTWADRRHRPEAGSLAAAVEATAALAASYLRLGDRVGLVDLTMPHRGAPPGTGRRQLMRIRWQLAGIAPDAQLRRRRFDEGSVPSGAVAIVLSPYLDDEVGEVVLRLARTRREVVLIDVLPDPLTMPTAHSDRVAARLVLAEREERLAVARHRGVLVVPWDPALVGVLMRRRQRMRRSA